MSRRSWAAVVLGAGLLVGACNTDLPFGDAIGTTASSASTGASSGTGGSGGEGGSSSDATTGTATATATATASTGSAMVECTSPNQCADDETCQDGECVPACKPGCTDTCCGGVCADLKTNVEHCGGCGKACVAAPNVEVSCKAGMCQYGACASGFFDCDGDMANGCESSTKCLCTPGATQACYPGDPTTKGVGVCKAGTRKCNKAGTAWGLCQGFVLPTSELCSEPDKDNDCDGAPGNVLDVDGDGWNACDGDCCETTAECSKPKLINPGAFEVLNNQLDDDCDPQSSDTVAPAACSTAPKFGAITALELAQAMEICQQTESNPEPKNRKWGLLAAEFRNPDGTMIAAADLANVRDFQTAVLGGYGTVVKPQVGATMAGLSNGRMRDTGDAGYQQPNPGTKFAYGGNPPAVYLNAHGGNLQTSLNCNNQTCLAGIGAYDAVNLRMTLRVPTNALSFAYQFRFFSAEFKGYTCSVYNDFFLALLTSKAAGIPADRNISFDAKNNPVSVNNGFFQVCKAQGCYACPSGTGALAGTGMEVNDTGGGTEWLQTKSPVVPGETMMLELMLFDVSDRALDSLVLLDAFDWSVVSSTVGTGPPG
jgi:hypothetical protein